MLSSAYYYFKMNLFQNLNFKPNFINRSIMSSLSLLILSLLLSCTTLEELKLPASDTQTGPRTLILSGKSITEEDVGGFISWYCVDYIYGGPILVEVGYFQDPKFERLGFILFDGGNTGEFTQYSRTGLDHRWDWGDDNDYAFVVKADGTGLYYDFSTVKPGTATKARDVFKTYKR